MEWSMMIDVATTAFLTFLTMAIMARHGPSWSHEAYLLYGILNLDKPVNPSSHEAAAR